MFSIIGVIVFSLLGAWLYRKGGAAKSNTKFRDVGVAVVVSVLILVLGIRDWSVLFSGVLLMGALTTYWDKVNKFFKRDEQEFWLNWMLTGIGYSLASLPTVIQHKLWVGFWIRTVLLPVLFIFSDYLVDSFSKNVVLIPDRAVPKEYCRGFFTVVTVPLLFIGFEPLP